MEQNEQDRKKLPSYNARDETQNKKYKCKERRVDGRSRRRGGSDYDVSRGATLAMAPRSKYASGQFRVSL